MKYIVVITAPAEQDLIDVADYISIELKEPQTAKKLISRIKKAVLALDEFPHRQAVIDPKILGVSGIYYLPIEHYLAFYHVRESDRTVRILRIIYGKRDWQNLLHSKLIPDEQ